MQMTCKEESRAILLYCLPKRNAFKLSNFFYLLQKLFHFKQYLNYEEQQIVYDSKQCYCNIIRFSFNKRKCCDEINYFQNTIYLNMFQYYFRNSFQMFNFYFIYALNYVLMFYIADGIYSSYFKMQNLFIYSKHFVKQYA